MQFPKKKRIKDPDFYREYQQSHPWCEFTDCGEAAWLGPHHIIFRSQGGGDTEENLIALCKTHHDQAHGINSRQFRVILQEIKSSL